MGKPSWNLYITKRCNDVFQFLIRSYHCLLQPLANHCSAVSQPLKKSLATAGANYHGNVDNGVLSSWSKIIITLEKGKWSWPSGSCPPNSSADIWQILYSVWWANGGERLKDQPITPSGHVQCLLILLRSLQTVAANGTLCRFKWDWFGKKMNGTLQHFSCRYVIVFHSLLRKDDSLFRRFRRLPSAFYLFIL